MMFLRKVGMWYLLFVAVYMATFLPVETFQSTGDKTVGYKQHRVYAFQTPTHPEYWMGGDDLYNYRFRFDRIAVEIGFITVCFGILGLKNMKQ